MKRTTWSNARWRGKPWAGQGNPSTMAGWRTMGSLKLVPTGHMLDDRPLSLRRGHRAMARRAGMRGPGL